MEIEHALDEAERALARVRSLVEKKAGYSRSPLTVAEFAAKHPTYTKEALRGLIVRNDRPGNPFAGVVTRESGRVYLDERKFFAWLRTPRARKYASTRKTSRAGGGR